MFLVRLFYVQTAVHPCRNNGFVVILCLTEGSLIHCFAFLKLWQLTLAKLVLKEVQDAGGISGIRKTKHLIQFKPKWGTHTERVPHTTSVFILNNAVTLPQFCMGYMSSWVMKWFFLSSSCYTPLTKNISSYGFFIKNTHDYIFHYSYWNICGFEYVT